MEIQILLISFFRTVTRLQSLIVLICFLILAQRDANLNILLHMRACQSEDWLCRKKEDDVYNEQDVLSALSI